MFETHILSCLSFSFAMSCVSAKWTHDNTWQFVGASTPVFASKKCVFASTLNWFGFTCFYFFWPLAVVRCTSFSEKSTGWQPWCFHTWYPADIDPVAFSEEAVATCRHLWKCPKIGLPPVIYFWHFSYFSTVNICKPSSELGYPMAMLETPWAIFRPHRTLEPWKTQADASPQQGMLKQLLKGWLSHDWLVVVYPPLWKMMEFVSWDDGCNPIYGKIINGNQTTNQMILRGICSCAAIEDQPWPCKASRTSCLSWA